MERSSRSLIVQATKEDIGADGVEYEIWMLRETSPGEWDAVTLIPETAHITDQAA